MPRAGGLAIRLALLLVAALGVLSLLERFGLIEGLFAPVRNERSVMQILKSEEMGFLVTQRVTTLVLVELDENSLLLGNREGILIATVRYYFGMDLEKLTEDSLVRSGDTLVVSMPDPEILDLSPDLATLRLWDKRSGLVVLGDLLTGYDQDMELLGMLDSSARAYADSEQLVPARDAVIQRLNRMAPLFAEYAGIAAIRFR
jgi:hypothetical protein